MSDDNTIKLTDGAGRILCTVEVDGADEDRNVRDAQSKVTLSRDATMHDMAMMGIAMQVLSYRFAKLNEKTPAPRATAHPRSNPLGNDRTANRT